MLDLTVRVWIHLLAEALRGDAPPACVEIVEGVRSLLVAGRRRRDSPLTTLAEQLVEFSPRSADPDDRGRCRPAR